MTARRSERTDASRPALVVRPRQARRLAFGVPRPLRHSGELSQTDQELIRLLQIDGRRSFTQLARALGMGSRAVGRRVEELQEDGVIEITTVSDPEILGYGAVGLLAIRTDGSRTLRSMARELADLDAVDYVVITSGRYELLAEVLCRDAEQLLTLVDGAIREIAGISETELLPYLSLHYQQPEWSAAATKPGNIRGSITRLELDEIDRAIVFELNEDGRVPYQQIGFRLGVSEGLVRQHVKRLRDSGAIRVMALVNPNSVGFRTLAWLGINAGGDVKVGGLADRLAQCNSITYLAVCAGRFDLLAEVACIGLHELAALIDDEIRCIQGIATVEAFLCLDLYYRGLRPSK